jgi:hypothetical protein
MLSGSGREISRFSETMPTQQQSKVLAFMYGEGRVIYLPELLIPEGEIKLGFETKWMMPGNADELVSSVLWVAGRTLPLTVTAPEWVGVSHDTQGKREVIHLFNYNGQKNVGGITLQYKGPVKRAWVVSPDQKEVTDLPFTTEGERTILRVPDLMVYKIIVLEKQ